jgi:cytochrome c-type biogenesis protein
VESISPWVAFGGGLLSLLSPCILPLIPVYLAVLAGPAGAGEERSGRRLTVFRHSLLFLAGFTLVFVALGAGVGWMGELFRPDFKLVHRIAGSFMIILGLFMLAANRISWLNYEKRLTAGTNLNASYIRSFMAGFIFALAWTPCVGPVLAGILTLAFNSESVGQGAILLFIYSLGLGLPFLAIALGFGSLKPVLIVLKRFSAFVNIVAGLLLMATGVLILIDRLNWYAW